MKKQQVKVGIFSATITVLLISMGNLPVATAQVPVPGTLTVIQFCDLQLVGSNMAFGSHQAGDTALGDFTLNNLGTGISTATITGDDWHTAAAPGVPIIATTDTSYAVPTNTIPLTAFTGGAQALGNFEGGGAGSETVDIEVFVNPSPITFTGALETTETITETNCAAA